MLMVLTLVMLSGGSSMYAGVGIRAIAIPVEMLFMQRKIGSLRMTWRRVVFMMVVMVKVAMLVVVVLGWGCIMARMPTADAAAAAPLCGVIVVFPDGILYVHVYGVVRVVLMSHGVNARLLRRAVCNNVMVMVMVVVV